MNKKLILGLFIIGVTCILGISIFQITDIAEKSYYIGEIQSQNKEVEKEISTLKVSLSQNISLDNLENKILEQGFEEIGKIDYIMVSSSGELASR